MTAMKMRLLREILPRVERPSRYLGGELNTVHKSAEAVDLRICLFFPDLYELGLGNLGLQILYAALNRLDWVWAERSYSPAPDMEALLREHHLPLFLYESKDPLSAADLIGFSLQSELTYTNVLNALDLAGIPLRADARDDTHPLVCAGGPAAFNPEPMAPFMDFFVIGDGEDAVLEIAAALRPVRHAPRLEKLKAVAAIEGVYVPAFYAMEILADGSIVPPADGPRIRKRIVADLDASPFPEKYIVPFTQLVHDGAALEVLRGCTHGCRFCHAGMVTRPVRERSLERIDAMIQRTLENTGLENISLVSLSTCDYSRSRSLLRMAAERAHRVNASVALPSLRLDSFSVELADMIAGVRRSGLTFAPEAATPRLRAVINKFIPDEDLIAMACEAYRRGWEHVKTYFMIGLPTETDEDVRAIADLCKRTLEAGRRVSRRAAIRTGVSTFVPKPFTPFQWAAQISLDETVRRQRLLADAFRKMRGVKFGRHAPEASYIEGLLSRADRRAADLIEAAWRHGARFETWDEQLNMGAWRAAIEETGYDVEAAFRERPPDARFPWDHIDAGVTKEWLLEEWRRALALEHVQDCRSGVCNLCGANRQAPELCRRMRERHTEAAGQEIQAETIPRDNTSSRHETVQDREPIQRIRFRIGRSGEARFLSHLEMQSAWTRALRRAGAPIAYSKGFHAHPKVTFAAAAPLGEESEGDYMDVVLDRFVYPDELLARLRETLPRDFHVYDAADAPLRGPSLMSSVVGFAYTLFTEAAHAPIADAIQQIMQAGCVTIARKVKVSGVGITPNGQDRRKTVSLDIRPMIESLSCRPGDDGGAVIDFITRSVDGRLAKPREIIELLGLDPVTTLVRKRDTFL